MVFHAPERHQRVSGGRGIWKTDLAWKFALVETLKSRMREGWYTAPTQRWAKRIIWDWLNSELEKLPVKIKVGENAQDLVIRLIGGKLLRLVGMDKYESNRGGHPGVVVNDEKSYAAPEGFVSVVNPAIANARARTLDVFTPRGRNHAHRDWLEGWPGTKVPDTRSWKIKTEWCGTISQAEIDQYRPGGTKPMAPELFGQEWEGEFSTMEGLVFPEFVNRLWPAGHILPAEMWYETRRGTTHFCSIDYGFGDLAVIHWWAKTPANRLILYDEYAVKNFTPEAFLESAYRQRRFPNMIWADPTLWQRQKDGRESVGDQFIMALRDMKLTNVAVTPADNRFPPSIGHVRTMMRFEDGGDDMPQFMILQGTCPQAVDDLSSLEDTDVKPTGGFREGVSCHAADSVRYGAMTVYLGASAPLERPQSPRGPLADSVALGGEAEPQLDPLSGMPAEADEIAEA
jgi:hypothetical protein